MSMFNNSFSDDGFNFNDGFNNDGDLDFKAILDTSFDFDSGFESVPESLDSSSSGGYSDLNVPLYEDDVRFAQKEVQSDHSITSYQINTSSEVSQDSGLVHDVQEDPVQEVPAQEDHPSPVYKDTAEEVQPNPIQEVQPSPVQTDQDQEPVQQSQVVNESPVQTVPVHPEGQFVQPVQATSQNSQPIQSGPIGQPLQSPEAPMISQPFAPVQTFQPQPTHQRFQQPVNFGNFYPPHGQPQFVQQQQGYPQHNYYQYNNYYPPHQYPQQQPQYPQHQPQYPQQQPQYPQHQPQYPQHLPQYHNYGPPNQFYNNQYYNSGYGYNNYHGQHLQYPQHPMPTYYPPQQPQPTLYPLQLQQPYQPFEASGSQLPSASEDQNDDKDEKKTRNRMPEHHKSVILAACDQDGYCKGTNLTRLAAKLGVERQKITEFLQNRRNRMRAAARRGN